MPGNSPSSSKYVRKHLKKMFKTIMKSHHFQLPKYDLPIRLRPWFLVFTCAIMVILAFLGFTKLSHSLPLNDKFYHFICLCIATGVFYFIFDVEEEARRVWFWRHSGLVFTTVVCFFFGGLVSEIVQSVLPHQEFNVGHVVANWLGSALGLYAAYYIERYYRSRREIARLYRPLETTDDISDVDESDEEVASGTQLLPLYTPHPSTSSKSKPTKVNRLSDVWDEREDLFGIGESDEEEDIHTPRPQYERSDDTPLPPPKIVVTTS